MNAFARSSAIVVAVLGVVAIVFGVMFVFQAGSAEKDIASEIQPLKIAEVDARYEAVKASQQALAVAEEPSIQAGVAAPSATYTYLTAQRASLGLAKSNLGLAGMVRNSGIIIMVIGAGLVLAGLSSALKRARVVA